MAVRTAVRTVGVFDGRSDGLQCDPCLTITALAWMRCLLCDIAVAVSRHVDESDYSIVAGGTNSKRPRPNSSGMSAITVFFYLIRMIN